jgi:hypothetical protein
MNEAAKEKVGYIVGRYVTSFVAERRPRSSGAYRRSQ